MPRIAQFTISILPNPEETLSVHYATRDGTAIAGTDYTAREGTVIFEVGEPTKVIPVDVDDSAATGKVFYMDISWTDPTGKTVIRPTGTCIVDSSSAPPEVI
jgi:endoglucanase